MRGTSTAVKPAKGKIAPKTPPKAPQRRAPVAPTRAAPAAKAPPRRAPARPARKQPSRPQRAAPAPKLSQTPAAKRARAARRAAEAERDRRNKAARTRYAERRGIGQQRAAEQAAKREAAKARRKIAGKGRKPGKVVDERQLAIGWLEAIREHFAAHVPTSFDVTEAEIGAKTPWLVVGRYDFLEAMDYETLAHALDDIANDLLLEASIHPSRLSQIRILFLDPKAKRGESDSFVSKIGSWEMIISDLVGELVGGGDDDEGALANRYAETTVPGCYVYFSSEIVSYKTAPGFADKKTQTVRMK